jgi:hypothetical protein
VTSDPLLSLFWQTRGAIGARKDPGKNPEWAPLDCIPLWEIIQGWGTYTAELPCRFAQPQRLRGLWLDYE